MNQKSFANIILVLVIVAFVGVVGYFAFVRKSELADQKPPTAQTTTPISTETSKSQSAPTPHNETVNWATYRNDKLNIEMQYPQGWKLFEAAGARTGGVETTINTIGLSPNIRPETKLDDPHIHFGFPTGSGFYFEVLKITPFTCDNFYATVKKLGSDNSIREKCQTSTIAGKPALTMNRGREKEVWIHVRSERFPGVYISTVGSREKVGSDDISDIMLKILSTFKFIR